MRHRLRSRKLGRTSAHRLALYRNMVTSLLEHERIETTDAKAKEVRRVAERMITLGKRGTLHARRRALRVIRSRDVAAKVFGDLAERYRDRPGGYTRVLKVRNRVGDAAAMSIVELVDGGAAAARVEKPAKGRKAATKKSPARKASAAKKEPEKKAKKAPARKAAAEKTSARKSSAKKTATKKKSDGAKSAPRKAAPRKSTKKK